MWGGGRGMGENNKISQNFALISSVILASAEAEANLGWNPVCGFWLWASCCILSIKLLLTESSRIAHETRNSISLWIKFSEYLSKSCCKGKTCSCFDCKTFWAKFSTKLVTKVSFKYQVHLELIFGTAIQGPWQWYWEFSSIRSGVPIHSKAIHFDFECVMAIGNWAIDHLRNMLMRSANPNT